MEQLAVSEKESDRVVLHTIPGSLGRGSLEAEYGRHFPDSHPLEVQATTLDAYFGGSVGQVRVLNVTVNGHEPEALRGATKLLARTEYVIFQSACFPEVLAILEARGFRTVKRIDLEPRRSSWMPATRALMRRVP